MTNAKKVTAVLTGRPPVIFAAADWPVRASSSYKTHDGQVECQANRTWEGWIKARQHADGRWLVYGVADYSSNWQHERNLDRKAGVMLPASSTTAQVVEAIEGVGAELGEVEGIPGDELARDCVADLPPEELA